MVNRSEAGKKVPLGMKHLEGIWSTYRSPRAPVILGGAPVVITKSVRSWQYSIAQRDLTESIYFKGTLQEL